MLLNYALYFCINLLLVFYKKNKLCVCSNYSVINKIYITK